MRKIALFATLLLFPFTLTAEKEISHNETQGTVYICTGNSATKYHAHSRCKGLNNCHGSIVAISLEKAREMGRTACKICY